LTGRENVYLNGAMLGFSKKEVDDMYEEIVSFAELERFMDQKLKNYSSGMQVRLAFSMAIRAKADILLVDEVLAVGDADFQRKCYEYFKRLKKDRRTVVFVSHDMNAIKEYCDRAALVEENELRLLGQPDDVAREYSLLFMENNIQESTEEGKGKRWGNGAAKFLKVKASITERTITIESTVMAKDSVERLIYGLHISSQDGTELTATNNRMINAPDIESLDPKNEITFKWEMANIFNDGKYFVSVTLVDDVGTVLDWYNEATTFTVRRIDRSTTAIVPPLTVTHKTK
jgi:ABC-2 type transport system ATP-binding protein